MDDTPTHVENAVSGVKYKANRTDPEGSSMDFFTQVTMELRRNRVHHVIAENPKILIHLPIPKLEPAIVRESIKKAYEYWTKEQKNNFGYFEENVCQAAVESAKYEKKAECGNGDVGDGKEKHSKTKTKFGGRRNKNPIGDRDDKDSGENDVPSDSKGGKKRKHDFKWNLDCLNPKCNKNHPVKECENTTKELATELLKEYREAKRAQSMGAFGKKRNASGTSTRPKNERDAQVRDGCYRITLAEVLEVIGNGDYGSDFSAMPRRLLKDLRNAGAIVREQKLNEPLKLSPAIKLPDGVPFTASASVKIDVRISLPCGPLRLRNVQFMVTDQDMEEILLGRPLLKCLGFDIHLESVRQTFDNLDVSHAMATKINCDERKKIEPSKLCSLKN